MFKNLKKHSKLLILGLIFSTSLPFSSFAIEPQKPNDIDIVQAIKDRKRKREEKISKVLSDEYIIDGIIPNFVAEGDDKNQWPKCELPVISRLHDDKLLYTSHPTAAPCNRRVKNFFLIPDHEQHMHVVGYECIKHFGINGSPNLDKNLPKKLHIPNPQEAQKSKNQREVFIATKILKYFYDQRNWNNRREHKTINGRDVAPANSSGNFVLDIAGLKRELENEGYTPKNKIAKDPSSTCDYSLILTLYRPKLYHQNNNSYMFFHDAPILPEILEKNRDIIKKNDSFAYKSRDYLTSPSSFESDIPLSDDKIFEAFKFFCKVHDIYQPFDLKN